LTTDTQGNSARFFVASAEFGAELHARDPVPAPRERQRRLAVAWADLENRVVRRDACQRDELVV
jgi:hypothetical protein